METENYTPNVSIENPRIRRAVNATLQTLGIIVAAAIAIDGASVDLELSRFTLPAAAGIASLSAAYGLIVTQPNIPRHEA